MKEQRDIVLYLMDFHSCDELSHQEKIDVVKEGAPRVKLFSYIGKRMFGKGTEQITEDNREEWKKIRYLMDECLEDGYLREDVRYEDVPKNIYSLNPEFEKKYVGEFIFLTSKGKKLARPYYFYFKYLPEEFGDLKVVLIAILGTMIASPIWRPLLSFLGDKLGFYLGKLWG